MVTIQIKRHYVSILRMRAIWTMLLPDHLHSLESPLSYQQVWGWVGGWVGVWVGGWVGVWVGGWVATNVAVVLGHKY